MVWCSYISMDILAKEAKIGDILYCGKHSYGTTEKIDIYLPISRIDVYPILQLIIYKFDLDKYHEGLSFDSLEIHENCEVKIQRKINYCFFNCFYTNEYS
jgi:hypothetical protein